MSQENGSQTDRQALALAKQAWTTELAAMAQTIVDQARAIVGLEQTAWECQQQKHDALDRLRIDVEQRHKWQAERSLLLEKLAVARGVDIHPGLRPHFAGEGKQMSMDDRTHRQLSIRQDALYGRLSDDSEAADAWYQLQCLKARREARQPLSEFDVEIHSFLRSEP